MVAETQIMVAKNGVKKKESGRQNWRENWFGKYWQPFW
jgi:hypothetical protein